MHRDHSTTARCATGLERASHHFGRTVRAAVLLAVVCLGTASLAYGQNPGDPLFCRPNEGTTFLIVNGGAGVFTADPDCYGSNANNDTTLSIITSQGGSLAGTRAGSINYIYTPPNPTYTGLDTFQIPVTTCWNNAGGTCSTAGTASPGGPITLTITLNVIPATTTLTVLGVATSVPIPAGSVASCGAQGNDGNGPPAGAISGCTTAIGLGVFRSPASATTAHGTVANSGTTLLLYTPTAGYVGSDTFTYQVFGVNTDGIAALDSGNVSMQVTVLAPLVISPASPLAAGVPGTPYTSQTFTSTGAPAGLIRSR